jgi:hypothetical protein
MSTNETRKHWPKENVTWWPTSAPSNSTKHQVNALSNSPGRRLNLPIRLSYQGVLLALDVALQLAVTGITARTTLGSSTAAYLAILVLMAGD